MNLEIIAVGRRSADWLERACSDYAERLPRDWRLDIKLLRHESEGDSARVRKLESARLLEHLRRDTCAVLLDETGERMTSPRLAAWLQEQTQERRDVQFFIGGAYGVDDTFKRAVRHTLRLSDLTLPHQLARLLLVEQIYRAWAILHQHPYHHA